MLGPCRFKHGYTATTPPPTRHSHQTFWHQPLLSGSAPSPCQRRSGGWQREPFQRFLGFDAEAGLAPPLVSCCAPPCIERAGGESSLSAPPARRRARRKVDLPPLSLVPTQNLISPSGILLNFSFKQEGLC